MTTTFRPTIPLSQIFQQATGDPGTPQRNGETLFFCPLESAPHTKPHLSVNDEKSTWHCFTCGAGGGYNDAKRELGNEVVTPWKVTHSTPLFVNPLSQSTPQYGTTVRNLPADSEAVAALEVLGYQKEADALEHCHETFWMRRCMGCGEDNAVRRSCDLPICAICKKRNLFEVIEKQREHFAALPGWQVVMLDCGSVKVADGAERHHAIGEIKASIGGLKIAMQKVRERYKSMAMTGIYGFQLSFEKAGYVRVLCLMLLDGGLNNLLAFRTGMDLLGLGVRVVRISTAPKQGNSFDPALAQFINLLTEPGPLFRPWQTADDLWLLLQSWRGQRMVQGFGKAQRASGGLHRPISVAGTAACPLCGGTRFVTLGIAYMRDLELRDGRLRLKADAVLKPIVRRVL